MNSREKYSLYDKYALKLIEQDIKNDKKIRTS